MGKIAVVAFDGINPFHLSVVTMVFGEGLKRLGIADKRVVLCADRPGLLTTTSGFAVEVRQGLRAIKGADLVIVPTWRDPGEAPSPALLAALNKAHRDNATIVGLCLGTFVLAAAGLLSGRRATTHWYHATDLADAYPDIIVEAEALWIDEGDIVTSAGTAAAIDCCLHLVRRSYGATLANRLARSLVMAPQRSGNQAQYIEHPVPATADNALQPTLDWMLGNLRRPLSLDAVAEHAGFSRRALSRQFFASTGTTVQRWIVAQRVTRAQILLEESTMSVERIAEEVGFGAVSSLRLHFERAVGNTPTGYRREFRHAETAY